MDPIMMGIAAVVILVLLAGIFLIKKSKTNSAITSQPNVKRPKTLAEQQRELELQRQSQYPMPTAINSLPQSALQTASMLNNTQSTHSEIQAAEQLIQAQDYQGAITILRRAIKNHPAHTNLHFVLLNTYALAKDYQNFNAFYPAVLALNDFNLTTQANNLKMLVDEEHAMSLAASTVANTETAKTDGLDFDLFDIDQAASKPTETHALATASTPVVSQATPVQVTSKTDNALDFDFSLDTLDNKLAGTNTIVSKAPVSKATVSETRADELSFDTFDFDLPNKEEKTSKAAIASHIEIFAPVSTAPVESVKSSAIAADSDSNFNSDFNFDSDFDFDFELPATQSTSFTSATPAMQPVVNTAKTMPAATTTPDDDLDFDFDFELDAEPVTTSAATTTTNLTTKKSPDTDVTLASLDGKDLPKTISDALTISNPVTDESTAGSNEMALTSFNLSDELLLSADTTAAKPFNSASVTTAASEPVAAVPNAQTSTPSNNLKISDEMFDLSLEDEPVKPQPSTTRVSTNQAVKTGDTIDWSFDEPAATQTARPDMVRIAANTTRLTTAPVLENLSAVFEVVKNIDTDALNVDLAEQYVHLGEYDSAKRLLDEIKDSENEILLARADALRQRIA